MRRTAPLRSVGTLARRASLLVLLLLVVGPLVGRAAAHATLVASVPADDEVVTARPTEITLDFDEAVSVDRQSVTVLDPSGARVDRGRAEPSRGSTRLTVPVGDGGRGTYTVSYAVLSADGHVVTGSYTYHVGERTGAAAVDDAQRTAGATIAVLGRWIALLGSFVAAGVLWTALFVTGRAQVGPARRWTGGLPSARRVLLPAAAATLFGTAMALLGRAAELSGRSIDGAVTEIPGLVSGSRTGTVAGLRVLVALVLLVAVAGEVLLRRAPWLAAAGILAALLLPTFGGHATTTSPVAAAVLLDLVHVVAASVWVGGLAVLVLTWRDDGPPALADRARAYSRTALVAAPLTVLTGLARGWWVSQSWEALTSTQSGRLVLAKAVGAAVMLVFGWVHRRWLADRAREVVTMVVGMRSELLVAIAVLAVTAVLIDVRPPVDSVVRPFEGGATAGSVDVRLEVVPDRAGPNDVHMFFSDDIGRPVPVDAVELKVSSSAVEPRRVPLTTITASHSTATGVQLTRGTWNFDIVLVRKGVPASTRIEVPIR